MERFEWWRDLSEVETGNEWWRDLCEVEAGNEWPPRPIFAKTAPVSTNRAVNFGYRAILLFCQQRVWWKKEI